MHPTCPRPCFPVDIGPVDGHDLDNLVPILENVRDRGGTQPVMLHIKTEKGYGYPPAEAAPDKYHGVPKFDVATGKKLTSSGGPPSYTGIFADTLIGLAAGDRSVVAITAAMPGGTGVDKFGKRFPKRTFDVGIAEQHAVTFAGGMAVEGLKPFCAIYSTFLQRAYDQARSATNATRLATPPLPHWHKRHQRRFLCVHAPTPPPSRHCSFAPRGSGDPRRCDPEASCPVHPRSRGTCGERRTDAPRLVRPGVSRLRTRDCYLRAE